MLQDTDFFDKLAKFSEVGADVLCVVEHQESVSPDERYDVNLTWKFRGSVMGRSKYIIEPIGDEYQLFWLHLEFVQEWQNKGLYTTLVKNYSVSLPPYGIVRVVAMPEDKEAESRLASQGFAWVGHEFALDLRKPI